MASEDTTPLRWELKAHQQYQTLFEKLHQARLHTGGKTQTQDLVRTFMLGVEAFFPCSSVRVYFGGWHFEHFETQPPLELPPFDMEPHTLFGFTFQKKKPFFWKKTMCCASFKETMNLYHTQGVVWLQIYPLLDVNQNALGLIEITAHAETIPTYQEELMALAIQQLGVLLETGQQSILKNSVNKRFPSYELLGRLWRNEEEMQNAREREKLFASMILYFRDNLRMVDAWQHLHSLTPENEASKYDFKRCADFYFQKAYQFSNLLLYGHKMTHRPLKSSQANHDILALIHKSIAEFVQYHKDILLTIKTHFPPNPIQAIVDSSFFHIAIVYTLEHFFLQTNHTQICDCLVIVARESKHYVHVEIHTEQEATPKKPPQPLKSEPEQPVDMSLEKYGLKNLFLPFVKLAITHQGGTVVLNQQDQHIQSLCLEIPKNLSKIAT